MIIMKDVFSLVTQRLIIRPYMDGDVEQYVQKILETPTRDTPPEIRRYNAKAAFTHKMNNPVSVQRPFTLAAFDITKDNTLVLDINFRPRTHHPGLLDMAYYTMKPYRGQGMMTEALKTLLPYMVAKMPVAGIEAVVLGDNQASMHVLLKAGLQIYDTASPLKKFRYPINGI